VVKIDNRKSGFAENQKKKVEKGREWRMEAASGRQGERSAHFLIDS